MKKNETTIRRACFPGSGSRTRSRSFVAVTLCLVLGTSLALNFDWSGDVSPDGRLVHVTGPIQIVGEFPARGVFAEVEVVIVQDSTGAVATGRWQAKATGEPQRFSVTAEAHGRMSFDEGPVWVFGVAQARARGQITDAIPWDQGVLLFEAEE